MSNNPRIRRVIQYLWDSEPQHTDFDNDIICLGKSYSPVASDSFVALSDIECPEGPGASSTNPNAWPSDFLADVESRIWMSYRTNFPLIPRAKQGPSPVSIGGLLRGSGLDINGFTSDVGWGCMIRTGQSLLANCLSILKLGRDWRRPEDGSIDIKEAEIVFLFLDTPVAPFSVHNFVWHGEAACGKMPGEWFGPSAAASSIKALQNSYSQDMQVYISNGSDVYETHFMKTAISEDGQFRPTLMLLGLRLGIDSVNKVYWDSLKQFLSCSQAVGIAGGRPSSSHYFYGYQGDYLFYLDPHFPRASLNAKYPSDLAPDAFQSIHTNRIRRLHLEQMDPSMLVGILIKNQPDWDEWKANVMNSKTQKLIHVSAEPAVLRRSSISVGSDYNDDDDIDEKDDDDEGFVDVLVEPSHDNDAPVMIESIREEYDSCHDYDEDAVVRVGSHGDPDLSKNVAFDSAESCVLPMVNDSIQEEDSYNMAGQSIFLIDHVVESPGAREDTPEVNMGVVLVDRVQTDDSHDAYSCPPRNDGSEIIAHDHDEIGSAAHYDCENDGMDSDGFNRLSSSPVAIISSRGSSASRQNHIPIPGHFYRHNSSCSISSSPVKISRSYLTDKSLESEDWEYMAKSDATIQKSSI